MEKYLTGVGMNHLVQWAVDYFGWKEVDYVEMMKRLHPVGTYYWSSNSTSPAQLFGGTWQQVSGYYMYATTNTNTGGANSVTLTSSHMPSHTHTFSGTHTHSIGSHAHSINGHAHSGTTSHYHNISHTHNYGISADLKIGRLILGPYWNVFGMICGIKSSHAISSNGDVSVSTGRGGGGNTGSTTASGSLSSAGNGNSGGSSSTSVSYNGSNTSVTLNPPYINAYCWYRSA